MNHVQRAFGHAVRRVSEAGAHEHRQHESDERCDDTIVGRVIEDPLGEAADGAKQDEAEEHARRQRLIYIQRLCVMSMMSTLWNAAPPAMHFAKMRILSP